MRSRSFSRPYKRALLFAPLFSKQTHVISHSFFSPNIDSVKERHEVEEHHDWDDMPVQLKLQVSQRTLKWTTEWNLSNNCRLESIIIWPIEIPFELGRFSCARPGCLDPYGRGGHWILLLVVAPGVMKSGRQSGSHGRDGPGLIRLSSILIRLKPFADIERRETIPQELILSCDTDFLIYPSD
jgi:hypothetical protein